MKHYLLLLIVLVTQVGFGQQEKEEVLTNEQIVSLAKLGLSNQLITNKIRTSKCTFVLSTNALVDLKQNKVPDDIISEMMQAPYYKAVEKKTMTKTEAIIDNFYGPGIYLKHKEGNYSSIHSTSVTNIESGTTLGKKFAKSLISLSTVGIVGGGNFIRDKVRGYLSGSKSKQIIDTSSPEIYFYFDETDMKFNRSTSIDNNASRIEEFKGENIGTSSPNDFKLIELSSNRRDIREFEMGSYNKNNTRTGVKGVREINFSYEELSPHLYRIKIEKPLTAGEYCFFFTNQSVAAGAKTMDDLRKVKVFDFSINAEK